MRVVMEHQKGRKPSGYIEIEGVCLVGELSETRERCSRNKIPFVGAVEMTQDGGSGKIHLHRARVFFSQASPVMSSSAWPQDALFFLMNSAISETTGESGCEYSVIVMGGGCKYVRYSMFKWMNRINRMPGNTRNTLREIFRVIRDQHVHRYLVEFNYRFNRCFNHPLMIACFLFISSRIPFIPYCLTRMAEAYG